MLPAAQCDTVQRAAGPATTRAESGGVATTGPGGRELPDAPRPGAGSASPSGHSDNPLAALRRLAAARRALELEAETQVYRARLRGTSWKAIATALGVSRQAAHKRFRGRVGPRPTGLSAGETAGATPESTDQE